MSPRSGIILLAALALCQAFAGVAQAADSEEFWPEVSLFYGLSPRTRVYLDAAYAKGKESDGTSLDTALYLDISLKPVTRKELLTEDWQRNRYFWARIGYDRIFEAIGEVDPDDLKEQDVAEDRGIISLYGKAPLPGEVWVEVRARADLRWIGDDYSNRYRLRVEGTREFTVLERTVVPYLNYEWFYDTRYEAWTRTLWTAGAEVTFNKHFRYELYLSGQKDREPSEATLAAFGLVLKFYY